MIGSELFDTTPILIKIRYIKTFVEFRMSSEKKQPVSRNKIIEQFLHNTDCFSSCAARSRQRMKSEFSKQLKCFTPGKVGTKARGRASREKVGVIESVEIFGQDGVPSRFFLRLLFFLQFFLFLSRSSLLLGVVHSLRKNEFCSGTICNYDWYHLCDCHDDVFQKGNPLTQDCHFFLDIFCTLEKRKLIMENKWIPTVSVFLLPFLQTLPFALCVSALGVGWQSRRASGLPRFCSSPVDKLQHLVINHFSSPLLKVPLT